MKKKVFLNCTTCFLIATNEIELQAEAVLNSNRFFFDIYYIFIPNQKKKIIIIIMLKLPNQQNNKYLKFFYFQHLLDKTY